MITGRVTLTLTDDTAQHRRECLVLALVPDRAEVEVTVGARWPVVDPWALDELRRHEARLVLIISGHPDAVQAGVRAIRGDEWPVIG